MSCDITARQDRRSKPRRWLDGMSRPEASLALVRGLPGKLWACPVEPQLREASVGNERTFVGLDVHAWSVTGHALDADPGEIWQRKLTPDPADVLAWCLTLPGPVRVGYEAGPTGYGRYRFLNDHGVCCVVGAPSRLHRPHGDPVKTDARRRRAVGSVVEVGGVRRDHRAERGAGSGPGSGPGSRRCPR